MMNLNSVIAKIESLPKAAQQEVLDYIEFLLSKYQSSAKNAPFKFDWEGDLKNEYPNMSAVDLQHLGLIAISSIVL